MENEIWKDIPEYEGLYQISNLGRIKSFSNKGPKAKNPFLSLYLGKRGYKYVVVSKNYNQKTLKIHRLIAQLFIPNPENLATVNHKNFQKDDNRVENLEWMTHRNNSLDAYNKGRFFTPRGTQVGNSILKENQVLEIIQKYKPKVYTKKMLAKEYCVKEGCIKSILTGKSWNWLTLRK